LKRLLPLLLLVCYNAVHSQQIDSIYINLYTDSLKKGTFNYINIDGKSSNGNYLPLDSSHLIFSASAGQFSGNSLWLEPDFKPEKVAIKVVLKDNPAIYKEFEVFIKKRPDNERLKTADEIINEMKTNRRPRKKS
jgi:hypothetical protein